MIGDVRPEQIQMKKMANAESHRSFSQANIGRTERPGAPPCNSPFGTVAQEGKGKGDNGHSK